MQVPTNSRIAWSGIRIFLVSCIMSNAYISCTATYFLKILTLTRYQVGSFHFPSNFSLVGRDLLVVPHLFTHSTVQLSLLEVFCTTDHHQQQPPALQERISMKKLVWKSGIICTQKHKKSPCTSIPYKRRWWHLGRLGYNYLHIASYWTFISQSISSIHMET